jgi:hypothetical protein
VFMRNRDGGGDSDWKLVLLNECLFLVVGVGECGD